MTLSQVQFCETTEAPRSLDREAHTQKTRPNESGGSTPQQQHKPQLVVYVDINHIRAGTAPERATYEGRIFRPSADDPSLFCYLS